MEYLYVADTNLFFEGKRLEDLPWGSLGVDPIVIALTKPVQAEIDKHKKGGGRTRKRALEMFGRVRVMLETKTTETVIREASPRVILRMMVGARPDSDLSEVLDYSTADDRIVGIVAALSKTDDYAAVSLMTDDGGVAMTASGLELDFHLLDESWKRDLVVSEKDKEIADLKKDLATYRAQEPSITLSNVTDPSSGAHTVRLVPDPLPRAIVDELVERIECGHAMVTDFSVPEARTEADGTEVSYIAPSDEEVRAYQETAYPGWINQCRVDLESLHEGRNEHEAPVTVTFGLRNVGTRPASKMRITLEAVGSILLGRSSEDVENGETYEQQSRVSQPTVTRLATPPAAPVVEKLVKRPPKPQALRTIDIGKLASQVGTKTRLSDLGVLGAGSAFNEITRAKTIFDGLHKTGVMADLVSGRAAFDGALGLGKHKSMMRDLVNPTSLAIASPRSELNLSNLSIPRPFIPPKHDPEGFYFDEWTLETPIKAGALVCDLFRHQGSEELFDVEVFFPKDGTIKAAVLCRVQAENLTQPVEMRISVSRTVKQFDLTKLAEELVEALQS